MIAAVYARKSTEQSGISEEAKSVTRQIEHAKIYAPRRGCTVADEYVYSDDGISGAEFSKRPGFLRLMNALKPRPPFQALIMSEESRLGREAIETAWALKQIITAGVRVFYYLEDRERTLGIGRRSVIPGARSDHSGDPSRSGSGSRRQTCAWYLMISGRRPMIGCGAPAIPTFDRPADGCGASPRTGSNPSTP